MKSGSCCFSLLRLKTANERHVFPSGKRSLEVQHCERRRVHQWKKHQQIKTQKMSQFSRLEVRSDRTPQLSVLPIMEEELCFPHLLNTSCLKPQRPISETALIYSLLAVLSCLTVSLNLLVIISITHFKYRNNSHDLTKLFFRPQAQ